MSSERKHTFPSLSASASIPKTGTGCLAWNRWQVAEQCRSLDLHPQAWGESLAYLSTGRESNGFQLF